MSDAGAWRRPVQRDREKVLSEQGTRPRQVEGLDAPALSRLAAMQRAHSHARRAPTQTARPRPPPVPSARCQDHHRASPPTVARARPSVTKPIAQASGGAEEWAAHAPAPRSPEQPREARPHLGGQCGGQDARPGPAPPGARACLRGFKRGRPRFP
eukprot:scaffold2529_cov363-Prasinococcus_capsulatus_cf.AAC.17